MTISAHPPKMHSGVRIIPPELAYPFALLCALLGFAADWLLRDSLAQAPYIIPLATVVLAGLFAGTMPGLLVALIHVLGLDYLSTPPFGFSHPGDAPRALIFVTLSGMLLMLIAMLRRRERELELTLKQIQIEQELFTKLFQRLPVMITIYDPKLRAFRFNDEFRRTLGWSEEDAARRDFLELAYPEEPMRLKAQEHMLAISPGWREFTVTAKNGAKVASSWANIRLSDETQVGIGIDLRERIRAEEAVRRSDAQLVQTFRLSPIPQIIVRMRDGRYLDVNEAFLRLFGYSKEEIQGRTSIEFRLFQSPDVREDVYHLSKTRGELRGYEAIALTKKGDTRNISLYGNRIVLGGDDCMLSSLVDITDRIRAEQELQFNVRRLRATFDHAGVGMVEVEGPNDTIVNTNERLLQILGYSPNELLGKTIAQLTAPEDQALSNKMNARIHGGQEDQVSYEKRYLKRNGERIWVHLTLSAIHDPAGQHRRTITTVEDITDRRRSEERLRKSEAALREAVRARDEFISVASHELRTPLTAMKLQNQLMARLAGSAIASPEHRRDIDNRLDKSTRQIDRLTRLVDDMLDVSRIATGRLSLETGVHDLSEVVMEVAERFRAPFGAAHSGLVVSVDRDVTGIFDRFRIEQVVTNLLSNALKYGTGARPVELSLRRENDQAILSVRDYGMGISESEQRRIFNRFERATPGSKISGLGLGLYITQQIVHLHRGVIDVESKPGQGAIFVVKLPLVQKKPEGEKVAA